MHPSARRNYARFVSTYLSGWPKGTVVDIGAQDVNGSLRELTPQTWSYVGVDFAAGQGIDIVLADPYVLPIEDASVDVVVSSSCFEHSEFFWVLFLEIVRVLKPGGLFYLNVPSNGYFHRYPVDCWRMYPDAGVALARWGVRNGYSVELLESFTTAQEDDVWNDFVAVFGTGPDAAVQHPRRICADWHDFWNGRVAGSDAILNESHPTEDMKRSEALAAAVKGASEPASPATLSPGHEALGPGKSP